MTTNGEQTCVITSQPDLHQQLQRKDQNSRPCTKKKRRKIILLGFLREYDAVLQSGKYQSPCTGLLSNRKAGQSFANDVGDQNLFLILLKINEK